ncbi:DUF2652 domain-containing protein [Winogradskyella sp. 3972H.M.0a.05]|uniref:DUF2652 domain-containing protein n=1 Tax=Winogradskyella sp. 3972H.M.0a.05 TaxID=2950277 RepID=UPI003399D34F
MAKNALLFIPDISGFTEFVHHTAINHSQHIISELLELLLDQNNTGLELAEIEGDALFFYKLIDKPNEAEIRQQVEDMYLAFHKHLKRYEYERICQCGACSSAYNLSLKFVVHHGEIEFINVKDTSKPYGSSVIQVHRLLKNDIKVKEYALLTENVSSIKEGAKTLTATYDFGNITFTYSNLDSLKLKLPEVPPIPDDVPKHKVFDQTEVIELPILDLYEVISNFDYRLLWTKGIDRLEYEKNKVNRAGQKHKCLINKNQEVLQTTVKKKVEKNQMVYGESTQEIPFTKRVNIYYVLEELDNGKTKINIEIFADLKPIGFIMKPFMKKNFRKVISENIKELILLIDSGFSLDQKN